MRFRRTAVLLLAALASGACGSNLSEDERAFYLGLQSGSGTTASGTTDDVTAGDTTSGSTSTGTGASGSGTTTGAAGTPTSPSGSSGTSTAQPAGQAGGTSSGGSSTGGAAPSGGGEPQALACAAPTQAPGVTDTKITLGNVSQISGVVPGFAQTAVDGAQAYVAYVNATGGLCNRQLELIVADDGFDDSRSAAEVRRLEPDVLGFAGGFSVTDTGYATVLEGTNVLDAGVATSDARRRRPGMVTHQAGQTLDDPPDAGAVEWTTLIERGATKGIIVHVAAAAARTRAQIDAANMRATGLEVEVLEISNTQFSYAGPVRSVYDSGADILLFIHDINGSIQMLKEMRDQGEPLMLEWYRIAYGQDFLDRAGDDAEGVASWLAFVPFEEADQVPEMKTFIEWLGRVAPGTNPDFNSINGWISVAMMVEAIRGVDGPITRDALWESAKSLTSFDANGLIAPIDVINKAVPECWVLVRVVNGVWKREVPDSGFVC